MYKIEIMQLKRTFVVLIFAMLSVGLFAQKGMKLGAHVGLPIADFTDEVSVVAGLDVGYMWALGEVVDAGFTVGFINGFPEKYHTGQIVSDLPSIQFAPVGASVRIWPSNSFSFGADAGQAFGINDGNDGGLYVRPMIAYLMGPMTEINLSYSSIKMDNLTWATVTIGFLCTFDL